MTWLNTNIKDLFFEDTTVGRLKKKIWEASDEEISRILAEYEIPTPSELGKPGTYIQNTIRKKVMENRKKNDILFIPVGCTELHGVHTVTGLDTFMVTQILEGVRRYTAKKGAPVNLSWTPLNFGGHPHHHIGMPGTIHLEDEVVKRILIDVMVGFWNDGFRKIILINNHGHQWLLEAAIQELQKTWNLPGIFRVIDWHRSVRKFFRTKERGGDWDTNFVHADEAETSVMLLLSPEYVDMEYAEETSVEGYLPEGHFDKAVDPFARPSKWSEGQGHFPIELAIRDLELLDIVSLTSALKGNSLTVPAIGTGQIFCEKGLSFTNPDPAIREEIIMRIKSHISLADKLNAIVIIGLVRGKKETGITNEQSEQWLIEAVRECASENKSVKLAIEPINRYETDIINTVTSGLSFIEKVSMENVGLLLDTFHMNIEEPSMVQSVILAKEHLFHFHIADSNRWYPGAGHINFTELFSTLIKIDYQGFVSAGR